MQKHEGTGLGLPIARRWVELLGGTISVASELDKARHLPLKSPLCTSQKNGQEQE